MKAIAVTPWLERGRCSGDFYDPISRDFAACARQLNQLFPQADLAKDIRLHLHTKRVKGSKTIWLTKDGAWPWYLWGRAKSNLDDFASWMDEFITEHSRLRKLLQDSKPHRFYVTCETKWVRNADS